MSFNTHDKLYEGQKVLAEVRFNLLARLFIKIPGVSNCEFLMWFIYRHGMEIRFLHEPWTRIRKYGFEETPLLLYIGEQLLIHKEDKPLSEHEKAVQELVQILNEKFKGEDPERN